MSGAFFNERLQCNPVRLDYDFDSRSGVLMVAQDHCTDMQGCIDTFKALDPEVKRIIVIEPSGQRVNLYRKDGEKWSAR